MPANVSAAWRGAGLLPPKPIRITKLKIYKNMSNEAINPTSCQTAVRRCVCPKCKSTDLTLTELWKNHSVQFYYKNGEIVGKGNLECGDPYKVEAFCNDCNHEWRLKGITQISDVSQHIA